MEINTATFQNIFFKVIKDFTLTTSNRTKLFSESISNKGRGLSFITNKSSSYALVKEIDELFAEWEKWKNQQI